MHFLFAELITVNIVSPQLPTWPLGAGLPKSVHTETYKIFLHLLREARTATGLSQRDLAKRLSVGQSVISKCESGERQLNIVELREWCVKGLGLNCLTFMAEFETALAKQEKPSSSKKKQVEYVTFKS